VQLITPGYEQSKARATSDGTAYFCRGIMRLPDYAPIWRPLLVRNDEKTGELKNDDRELARFV